MNFLALLKADSDSVVWRGASTSAYLARSQVRLVPQVGITFTRSPGCMLSVGFWVFFVGGQWLWFAEVLVGAIYPTLAANSGRVGGRVGIRYEGNKGQGHPAFALPIFWTAVSFGSSQSFNALQGFSETLFLQALTDQVKPPSISLHSNTAFDCSPSVLA